MKLDEAMASLDPERWGQTGPIERLHLLEQIRERMKQFQEELTRVDANTKNALIGREEVTVAASSATTIIPIANTITSLLELYESLAHGEMPEPLEVGSRPGGKTDVKVFPRSALDKAMNVGSVGWLRLTGEPTQINPYDRPVKTIGVLGAGNFSSSIEMVRGLFIANCVVLHKPHHHHVESDKVWEKIFAPLIELGAVAFLDGDQSRALSADERVDTLYFTGGVETAKIIEANSTAQLVSELGGNNPCIVVPGIRPWTEKELEHQAIEIATQAKLNGGAVCGRAQTIVTSRSWPQRGAFLDALRKAIVEQTPADSSWYPGTEDTIQGFQAAYGEQAEVLRPEGGTHPSSDLIFIPDAGLQSYATKNEAFCQILSEVALDVPADAPEFLVEATRFCNEDLLGSLGCMILIDEDTKSAHEAALDRALLELRYGAIAVNNVPPNVWLNPWLSWGGNEEGLPLESGRGNFGNAMCYDNVEKAILISSFMSAGHMMRTHKADFDALLANMARFSLEPGWLNMARSMGGVAMGAFHKKDF